MIIQLYYHVFKFASKIKLPNGKELEVAIDGTGMRISNKGLYREFKYNKRMSRKKYIVVTITADAKRKKLLNFDMYIEGQGDLSLSPQ